MPMGTGAVEYGDSAMTALTQQVPLPWPPSRVTEPYSLPPRTTSGMPAAYGVSEASESTPAHR